jgi:Ca2+/Na+ antiporter
MFRALLVIAIIGGIFAILKYIFELIVDNASMIVCVIGILLVLCALLVWFVGKANQKNAAENNEEFDFDPIRGGTAILSVLAICALVGSYFLRHEPILISEVDAKTLQTCFSDSRPGKCEDKEIVVHALVTEQPSADLLKICFLNSTQGSQEVIGDCNNEFTVKLEKDEPVNSLKDAVVKIGFLPTDRGEGKRGYVSEVLIKPENGRQIALEKLAKKAGMTVAQYVEYQHQVAECKKDWRACRTNQQLVDDSGKRIGAALKCENYANKTASFGKIDFPWDSFGSYLKGTDYVTNQIMILIENNAMVKNGFGGEQRMSLRCYFDLKNNRVAYVEAH